MGSDGASDGLAAFLDRLDGCTRCCVLEHDAKTREGSVKFVQVGKEHRFGIQDADTLRRQV